MKTTKTLLLLVVGLIYRLSAEESSITSKEEISRITNPILVEMPDPKMPLSLQTTRMYEPKATVEVVISEDGAILDVFCVSADHFRMAKQAESIAKRSVYVAATENGLPIPSRSEIEIDFIYQSNGTIMKTQVDDLIDFIGRTSKKAKDSLIYCQPRELDEPLRIEWMPPMVIVKDEFGDPHYGNAMVEGYVDMDGKLRFLSVIRADSPYIGEAAIRTFQDLVFNKPRAQGIRATTLIRIPFEIREP